MLLACGCWHTRDSGRRAQVVQSMCQVSARGGTCLDTVAGCTGLHMSALQSLQQAWLAHGGVMWSCDMSACFEGCAVQVCSRLCSTQGASSSCSGS